MSEVLFFDTHTSIHLGDTLWTSFVHGLAMAGSSCLVQNLLNFFVILHLEVLGPIVELMEPNGPPDVVQGGDQGQMRSGLLVELLHQLSPGSASFAFSSGLFVDKEGCVNQERHDRPKDGQAGPSRVVSQQLHEGEEVRPYVR